VSWEREADYARQAALEAGRIIRSYFGSSTFDIASKGHDNPVTSVDLEADAAIRAVLTREFPDYGWLSEETADDSERLSRRRVWIVDPLDGTKEFIARIPEFSVAVALVEDGLPVVGVTYNPIREEMYWAAKGTGCFVDSRRLHVSIVADLQHARLLASRSEVARGEWKPYESLAIINPTGSVAYKLALVAAGIGDATLSRTPKSEWDVAAGAALIAEAGGRMTEIDGSEMRFNRRDVTLRGLIGSNGLLHDKLVDLVARSAPLPPSQR
jgi:myo-inositol-1(or 4)-monophosphatase